MTVKILAVDDSATMRKIFGMTFAGEDAVVVTAASAGEAIEKALHSPPDVVLADAALDGTDGYALAQALKAEPSLANTAVILLASQHHPYDEARGRASGVDDHVAKPFDTQAVIDKVADATRRPRRGAAPPALPAAPPALPAAPPALPAAPPALPAAPPGLPATPPGLPEAAPPLPSPSPAIPERKQTVAFGAPAKPVLELADEVVVPDSVARFAPPAAEPAAVAPAPIAPAAVAPAPIAPAPIEPAVEALDTPAQSAMSAQVEGRLAGKLERLGLTEAQIAGVLALSREVVEQVVWEVVPDLAETLIREELHRLTRE